MKIIVLTEAEYRAILIEVQQTANVPINQQIAAEEHPVSQQEICEFLNITEPTIIRWRNKGVIPFLKIGSRILYQKCAVIAAISGKKKGAGRGK